MIKAHLNEREKQLAIEMWEQIRAHMDAEDFNVEVFKCRFCIQHDLDWDCNCWLCTVAITCADCPLQCCLNIDHDTPYMRASRKHDKHACDEIVEAIKSVEVYR